MLPAIAGALARAGAATGSAELASTAAAMQSVSTSAREMTQVLERSGGVLRTFTSKIAGVSTFLTDALTSAATAVKAFADPIVSLTALSNPASLKLFTLAANDAFAVIGRGLLPVTEALTRAMRKVGDTFATLEPVFTPVAKAFAKMIDEVATAWAEGAVELGPVLRIMADVMVTVIQNVSTAAQGFLRLAKWLAEARNVILGILGINVKGLEPKSAFGSAVRSVSITRSAEDVSRRAQEQAFMIGLGAKKDPAVETVNYLDKILQFLTDNLTFEKIAAALLRLREEVIKEGGSFAKGAAAGFGDVAAATVGGGAVGMLANAVLELNRRITSTVTR